MELKIAIIICLILSMFTVTYNTKNGKTKLDIRFLFSIAALVLFLIRG